MYISAVVGDVKEDWLGGEHFRRICPAARNAAPQLESSPNDAGVTQDLQLPSRTLHGSTEDLRLVRLLANRGTFDCDDLTCRLQDPLEA